VISGPRSEPGNCSIRSRNSTHTKW